MITASVTLDTAILEKIKVAAPTTVTDILLTVAYAGEADAKMNMSRTAPLPSAPGEPPAVQTGTLMGGIHADPQSSTEVWIVSSAEYDMYLELGTEKMAARPFMGPMAKRLEKQIPGFFEAGLKDVWV